MRPARPHILLVNPWIHDFAAYDFWARPYGLLLLAAVLRLHDFRVTYLDCLDRFHPRAAIRTRPQRRGRGPYLKTPIPKPPGLEDVPRTFSRYGIPVEWLQSDLEVVDRPDLILVTGLMTYWASGVAETIGELRQAFPEAPIALGGVYATLCPDHARRSSGADRVVSGPGERTVLDLAAEVTGRRSELRFDPDDLDTHPFPAFDLQRRLPFVPLLTVRGCPYRCAYCASSRLAPVRRRQSVGRVMAEIEHWHHLWGVRDFAFYDDALLVDPDKHARRLFEAIAATGLNLRLHTPNALHIRCIDAPLARAMRRAGMQTVRLGLETTDFEGRRSLDVKVTAEEFKRAAACLKSAGFSAGQLGAYLLVGLPGQSMTAVEAAVRAVHEAGILQPLPRHAALARGPGRLGLRSGSRSGFYQQRRLALPSAGVFLAGSFPPQAALRGRLIDPSSQTIL